MDAQKIMDEIGVFLDRSLLKKSKITKVEIIRFIEAKWAEADDEKNRVYASYIYAARMVNEYKWARRPKYAALARRDGQARQKQ